MRLASFAVQRFQFTLVVFFLLVALGFYAFSQIPRQEDPHFDIPILAVVAVLPGADPVDMEKLVAEPIEDALDSLDDVKKTWSQIEAGVATVRVEFDWSKDAEKKYDEAIREINTIRSSLPKELRSLDIIKANPGNVNIVQFALVSPRADYRQMHAAAEALKDRFEQVQGVRTADWWGVPEPEIQIALDLVRLAQLKIPLTRVLDAIDSENADIPGGAVDVGTRRFNIKATGGYDSLDEVANTVITAANGRIVRLRDVAQVRWGEEETAHITRFNGRRAAFVTASQKDGYNIFDVRAALYAEAADFATTLPPDIRLEAGFDQAKNVQKRLGRLTFDLGLAIALVLVTLLPLGLRAASVVMVSIPLSMAVGMAALYLAGFSLNQLAIAGFVLAIGLLVDDSIVVTENIARFLREGHSRREAAIRATEQIWLAVLGCTATLLFAFLPLFFLSEGSGKFVRSMPTAVTFTIIASLLVSLTIIPFLASRWLPERSDPHGNRFLQLLQRGIRAFYRPLLAWSLGHPRKLVAITGMLFVASLGLVPMLGVSLFPLADVPQFIVTVDAPPGASVAETDRAVKHVEQRLLADPAVQYVYSNAGHGNPQIFYNVFMRETRSNIGELFVQLHAYDPKTTPALYDRWREEFGNYPAAQIIIKPFENGPPVEAPIAIRITGPELAELDRLAAAVAAAMHATEGTRDVANPVRLKRTDINLGIDSDKSALLGVPAASIDRTVRLAIAGESIGKFRDDNGDDFDIVVRLPLIDETQRLSALDAIYVDNVSGAPVPLAQLGTPAFETAPASISHYKRVRSVTVTAYVATGHNPEAVTAALMKKLETIELKPGYRFGVGGAVEARQQSFAGLTVAGLVALFGILAVLILEFGSFKTTAVVATVIPLGIMGGLATLALTGYSVSFMAGIGFVALIGIEIKNSILLVDFTNRLRQQGVPLIDAIQQAGEVRFLPIFLTSLTAIGGLLPLALQGSGLYSPLAWVIIGGLVSSTLLARLVTPVMYLLLAPPADGNEALHAETGRSPARAG
ncbi:MAG: efflux RND transporter permease subunit [Pseudomonadota bacterium]